MQLKRFTLALKYSRRATTLFVFAATAALIGAPALAEDAAGNWFGAMDGHNLTFIHIEEGVGGLSGFIDTHELPASPNNHNDHAALETLSATPDQLTFHFVQSKSSGTFDGRWDATKKSWTGKVAWTGGHKANLTLYRTSATTLATAKMPPPKEVNDSVALDRVVNAYVDNRTFMGSVLVARGDRILLDKAYGFANMEWKIPATPNTRFMIGSISKQFAAAAILMLEEQGKLRTDDSVTKYIPGTPESWKAITLHHLLTHTSGIPNTDTSERVRTAVGEPVTPDEIIFDAKKRPLDFPTDSQFGYSNTNYVLLARIVENVSGDVYADFLKHHIFEPLGMNDTSLFNDTDLIPNFAAGYDFGSNSLINPDYEDAGWLFGCGSIVSTTHDLLLWERGLMSGKVLSPETLKRMITPYKNYYGYGVGHGPFNGYSVINHFGAFRGFSSAMSYFPDDKLTVIVLSNLRSIVPGRMGELLAMVAHGESVGVPPARTFAKVSPDILKTYVGTYRIKSATEAALSLEGHKLVLTMGDLKHELTAQTDTRFFLAWPEVNIQFVKDDTGKTSMIYEQDGQKVNALRKE